VDNNFLDNNPGTGFCHCFIDIFLNVWCILYTFAVTCAGDGQSDGNTRQYRNRTVCVGCTERTLVVNILHYSFVCLHCVVPVLMLYRWCLVTVHIKVLQKGRLVRFSNRTDSWCMFSLSIYNQISHFLRCIQISSFRCYDGIHKSWEDKVGYEE
jgi:hypothetical protein